MTEHTRKLGIRSFVLRARRMTNSQNKGYQTLWDEYGIEFSDHQLDIDYIFGRKAPLILEIGFGMGDSLLTQALLEPERNFLGIEVHKPGVGRLMNEAKKAGVSNLKIMCEDAVEVLAYGLPSRSLEGVQIYFPDPWHKKRHHKRRIIQPDFIKFLADRVGIGGFCHLATDWEPYAVWMLELFSRNPVWQNISNDSRYASRPDRRPITKFEIRGAKLGHNIFDLVFKAKALDKQL